MSPSTDYRPDVLISQVRLCGQGSKLLYKPDEARVMVHPLFCDRWECPVCASKLEGEWTRHILEKAPQGLYYWVGSSQVIEQFFRENYVAWRRQGVHTVRISHNGGTTLLSDVLLPQAKELSQSFELAGFPPEAHLEGFAQGPQLQKLLSLALAVEDKPLNGKHKIKTSRFFARKRERKGWVDLAVEENCEKVVEKLVEWGSELQRREGEKYFLKVSEMAIIKILELTSEESIFIYDNLTVLSQRSKRS